MNWCPFKTCVRFQNLRCPFKTCVRFQNLRAPSKPACAFKTCVRFQNLRAPSNTCVRFQNLLQRVTFGRLVKQGLLQGIAAESVRIITRHVESLVVKFIHHRQMFISPLKPEKVLWGQVAQAAQPLGGGGRRTNAVG
jgi:hypothetical protein